MLLVTQFYLFSSSFLIIQLKRAIYSNYIYRKSRFFFRSLMYECTLYLPVKAPLRASCIVVLVLLYCIMSLYTLLKSTALDCTALNQQAFAPSVFLDERMFYIVLVIRLILREHVPMLTIKENCVVDQSIMIIGENIKWGK